MCREYPLGCARPSRTAQHAVILLIAAVSLWATPPAEAKNKPEPVAEGSAPIATLKDAGLSYEAAQALPDADRSAALQALDKALGDVDRKESTDEARAAARFLSAEIKDQLGDHRRAAEGFRDAAGKDAKGAYADDAAFAAIQAMEAAGDDREAQRAWLEWEGRYPQSPLIGEARLADQRGTRSAVGTRRRPTRS